MSKLFYLQDSRSLTGSNVMFWKINGAGYGTNLNELEVYSLESAQMQHSRRETDIPLLKSEVDKLSISAVDMQVLPQPNLVSNADQYIVQRNGEFNGNDILFVTKYGETYSYDDITYYTKAEIDNFFIDKKYLTVYSKESIVPIVRRTFQAHNINKRKMISKAGIKLIRPRKSRPTTGKTRGNCRECGKITWAYNPYESAYCLDHR